MEVCVDVCDACSVHVCARSPLMARIYSCLTPNVPRTGCGSITTRHQQKAVTEPKEILTHTSFLVVLFRSLPYSLADMKCSLKAGMSLSVAMHPRTDMQQLMMRGRTGTGDILETPIYSNDAMTNGQVWTLPCRLSLRDNQL